MFLFHLSDNCSETHEIKAPLSDRGMALIDLTLIKLFDWKEKIDIASEKRHKLRFLLTSYVSTLYVKEMLLSSQLPPTLPRQNNGIFIMMKTMFCFKNTAEEGKVE